MQIDLRLDAEHPRATLELVDANMLSPHEFVRVTLWREAAEPCKNLRMLLILMLILSVPSVIDRVITPF